MGVGRRRARIEMAIVRGRRLALFTLAALAVIALGASVAMGGSTVAIPATHTCKPASAARSPPAKTLESPPQTVSRRADLVAVVETNCGSFDIQLDARRSPRVVNSF